MKTTIIKTLIITTLISTFLMTSCDPDWNKKPPVTVTPDNKTDDKLPGISSLEFIGNLNGITATTSTKYGKTGKVFFDNNKMYFPLCEQYGAYCEFNGTESTISYVPDTGDVYFFVKLNNKYFSFGSNYSKFSSDLNNWSWFENDSSKSPGSINVRVIGERIYVPNFKDLYYYDTVTESFKTAAAFKTNSGNSVAQDIERIEDIYYLSVFNGYDESQNIVNGIYKSTDGITAWELVKEINPLRVRYSKKSGNYLVVTDTGIMVGKSFETLETKLTFEEYNPIDCCVLEYVDSIFMYGDYTGLHCSFDEGMTWNYFSGSEFILSSISTLEHCTTGLYTLITGITYNEEQKKVYVSHGDGVLVFTKK